jgi:inosose dehydratase
MNVVEIGFFIFRGWQEKKMGRCNRREFIRNVGITTAGAAMLGGWQTGPGLWADTAAPTPKAYPLPLALASYTTRKFTLDQTLEMAKRVGLEHICLKSVHLPLDSSPEAIQAAAAKVRQAGLDLYSGGNIGMKNEKEVDQAFQYAKLAGMRVIICSPVEEVLPLLNKKVQEYNIKAAIHNHGPKDNFPIPQTAYEKIKGLDPRVGLCIDVGHTLRAGSDPAAAIRQCGDRIHDLHIKDVDKAAPEGSCVEAGRGVLDLHAVLKALIDVHYAGFCSFEYEKDANDPLPGLAESVGYVRGLMRCL